MADTYWGRYKTINVAIGIATLGHVIIIISAIPQVIVNPNGALAAFVIGLIFFGIGVGFFKCNISPMVAENMEARHPRMFVETLKSGERVIVDPTTTISIVYMRYYWMINVGALLGQISMVYAEKYVGFWLSYTLPTILFLFCPVVMIWCKNKYVMRPPTGSVLSKSFKLLGHILKTNWTGNPAALARKLRSDDTWNAVKPTYIEGSRPPWMTWDDIWVDEVRRGLKACTVFVWYPICKSRAHRGLSNINNRCSLARLLPNDEQPCLPSINHETRRRTKRHCSQPQPICSLDLYPNPRQICLPSHCKDRIQVHANQEDHHGFRLWCDLNDHCGSDPTLHLRPESLW